MTNLSNDDFRVGINHHAEHVNKTRQICDTCLVHGGVAVGKKSLERDRLLQFFQNQCQVAVDESGKEFT